MTTTLENNLLDAITALVMAPVHLIHGLLWLAWQGCKLCAPYRKYIGLAVAFAAAVGACVACPLLPLGLAITAAVGWVTMPRSAVRPC
jgi:hypothetical protein